MKPSRKCIATSPCLLLALLLVGVPGYTQPVGTVIDLSGTLVVKDANGAIKVVAPQSSLALGDSLVSRDNSYASIGLADHTSVTLGPDTELTIEKWSFDEAQPLNNTAVLNLRRGRVRIATGELGKRSADVFTLDTPSASIDIRGSVMIAGYIAADRHELASRYTPAAVYKQVRMRSFSTQAPMLLQLAQMTPPPSGAGLSPGLYVQVLDGAIHLSNGGGSQNFTAGQFGYTASFQQPPVVLPANPGMQFTPPPAFASTTGAKGSTGAAKPAAVDCQVR